MWSLLVSGLVAFEDLLVGWLGSVAVERELIEWDVTILWVLVVEGEVVHHILELVHVDGRVHFALRCVLVPHHRHLHLHL